MLSQVFFSCDDFDSWTTSDSALLTFQCDSISFDTIISTVSSDTKRLLVYNNNSKGIRIVNVHLQHGSASMFRVNVDGEYLQMGSGNDFEVRASDSIFCHVEVCLPELDRNEVQHYTDSICFVLESGQVQYIRLKAASQDAVHWYGKHVIGSDYTITADRPVVIYDTLQVEKGATLTLEAGATLMFHHNAEMLVDGRLIARGTFEKPVTLRGDRTGNLFSYLPYDNTPEQWGGVTLHGSGHVLDYVDMHASTYGLLCEDTDLELTNSVLNNNAGDALAITRTRILCYNTQISNSAGYLLNMLGGSAQFYFCTFAQYYNYVNLGLEAVYISDYEYDNADLLYWKIDQVQFYNCAITGNLEDVVKGHFLNNGPDEDKKVAYLFRNCYLKTTNSEGDSLRFISNLYETELYPIIGADQWAKFDSYARIYDFTPDTLSLMCDKAWTGVIDEHPELPLHLDRKGNYRLENGKADIGCYENVQRISKPQEEQKSRR